ncbi:hypothetical protein LCGC14_1540540 [marine sediment metagenome]|uniref:Uncharacterized protein n=1 Tax=marine sediment metagenome TaxID=412755 RepID=A0A0F9ITA9_9ZZZZ
MGPTKPSRPPVRDGGFAECTGEQFSDALYSVVGQMGVSELMAIPEVEMILMEELNNQVLEEWAIGRGRCEDCGQRLEESGYCQWCNPEEEEDGPVVGTAEGGAAPGCLD